MSDDTKRKMRKSAIAFLEKTGYKPIDAKVCECCGESFHPRNRHTKYCSRSCAGLEHRRTDGSLVAYRQRCAFKFGIGSFPDEFEFSLIEKHGWYAAKNRGDNLGGVSRDHMYSVRDGFDNGIDPNLIAHPANCKLMVHGDNIKKHKGSSITLDELKRRITEWDKKYQSK